ncbi:uromodulin-like isoform X2 [Pyxicephalus adspersus]|uniref:uromodulin-like isoform X2 n=1 Tax=Pyxicephalus adspersus TaxID=30357 RepID=UPI003B59DB3C
MHQLLLLLLVVSSTSLYTYGAIQATGQYGLTKLGEDRTCVSQSESSSLSYVVDTTGSMHDDFTELKVVNSWLLDRVAAKFPCGVRQYTMVEFNDPNVGPVRITETKDEFDAFFNSLTATGGGDCAELAIAGIRQALLFSPHQSFILVLTDASAKDYSNSALVNEVFSLIGSTKSQVVFLITGLCGTEDSPDYTIYRDISSISFGHLFKIPLKDLNKVFHYLDYTLSIPVNSSKHLFSGDFTNLVHNEYFSVNDIFSSLMITTDGVIHSLRLMGPNGTVLRLEQLVTETWGSMNLVKKPPRGNYNIDVNAGGFHAIRVQGFIATNISSAVNCSECHPDALCEEYADSMQCSCNNGFIGDGFNCSDIDECAYSWTHNCSVGTCHNTFGSYVCICPSGYNQLDDACIHLNKCDIPSLNACHPLATCMNKFDDYSCVCPIGYYGDGFHCEIDECWRGDCGFGIECTKSLGSYYCSDPCVNHIVLNEPWRSTDNTISLTNNCDISKNGWYQFVGSAGVRMPETCVPERRCNTDAPVWMSGTHPVISDGIVNRTACASWSGNCCQWTSTIQVKACPGGYHVYKLIGTPGSVCTLSYCTDASTVIGICKADEEWQLSDKGYGCYCKDQYKVSDLSHLHPELSCGQHEMKASFQKCQMKELDIYFDREHVMDSHCFGFEDDNATNTFSVLAPLNVAESRSCDVQIYQNKTHVTYKKTFYIVVETSGIITRNNTLAVSLLCVYKLDMMTSLNLALRPIISSVNITVGGTGKFTATMALFKDSSYTIPYEGSEVVLSSEDYLYIGVFVQGGDTSKYVLVMRNCYATPTEYANDSLKYHIIKDSPAPKQEVEVLEALILKI